MLLMAFPENTQQRMGWAEGKKGGKKIKKKKSLLPLLDWLPCGDELCILMAAGEQAAPGTRGDILHLAPRKAPAAMLQEGTREPQ